MIDKNASLMYMRFLSDYVPRAAMMLSADLKARAMMVSVGFAVATVGKLPLPTIQRFWTSCDFCEASTTDLQGSVPMRCVPMMWPAPYMWYIFPSYVKSPGPIGAPFGYLFGG